MSDKSIVVAGAGGNIGSHLTESLARMSNVGRVTLIDLDIYEARNIANQDIISRDVGKPKALVQARRLLEIRPNLEVNAIYAPLETLPLAAWRADLIVACLDSRSARQAVNQRAWRLGVPWVDSGVLGSEWLARVNAYTPAEGAACLECAWSDEDYRLLEQQYPCGGGANSSAPNGASSELGALAAAMLAIECRKILVGELECAAVGQQVTFNARWHRFAATSFRRNPQCRFDHATWAIEPLRCDTGEMRISDLLTTEGSVSVPGQRFVRRLVCSVCGKERRLFRLDGSLDPALRQCSACGMTMAVPGFDIIEGLDGGLPADVMNQTLDRTGLRYGDVLLRGARYFEITANTVMADET
jgi:molybdopterin/thiamine biosynthesis adenylyltransferase